MNFAYVARLIIPHAILILSMAAVLWQSYHMITWAYELSDGSAADYLRHHAYVYFDRIFGNPFGWKS